DVTRAFPQEHVLFGECRERLLNRRRSTEPVTRSCVGGVNFTSSLQYDRAERRALLQCQPLPERLEDRLLLGQQPRQGPVEILPPLARTSSHVSCARRWTSYGRLPASSTIASATPASGFMPVLTKRWSMKSTNSVGDILWSRITGPAL